MILQGLRLENDIVNYKRGLKNIPYSQKVETKMGRHTDCEIWRQGGNDQRLWEDVSIRVFGDSD